MDEEDFWNTHIITDESSKSIDINSHSITALINNHKPLVLICDIEGYEYEIISSIKDTCELRFIIIEIHKIGLNTKVAKNRLINELYDLNFDIDFSLSKNNALFFRKY